MLSTKNALDETQPLRLEFYQFKTRMPGWKSALNAAFRTVEYKGLHLPPLYCETNSSTPLKIAVYYDEGIMDAETYSSFEASACRKLAMLVLAFESQIDLLFAAHVGTIQKVRTCRSTIS